MLALVLFGILLVVVGFWIGKSDRAARWLSDYTRRDEVRMSQGGFTGWMSVSDVRALGGGMAFVGGLMVVAGVLVLAL